MKVEDFNFKIMKQLFFLFFIILVGCKSTQIKMPVDDAFLSAERIEIWSYPNREIWHREGVDNTGALKELKIENGKVNIEKNNIKEKIILSKEQIEKIYQTLYDNKICDYESVAACYQPRHLIVFFNSEDKVFNALEICLSCTQIQSINEFNYPNLCDTKMDKLEEVFKSFGIKYFDEK